MRVHAAKDQDARQALQLQVRLGPPLCVLDFLPHLQVLERKPRAATSQLAQLQGKPEVLPLIYHILW